MATPFIIALVVMVLATIVAFDLRSNSQSPQLPNKYDAYMKVIRTLKSCKTPEQVDGAHKMIYCFDRLYGDAYLSRELHNTLWNRKIELINNDWFENVV